MNATVKSSHKTGHVFVIEATNAEGKLLARAVTGPDKEGRYTMSVAYRNRNGAQCANHETLDKERGKLRTEGAIHALVAQAMAYVEKLCGNLTVPLER